MIPNLISKDDDEESMYAQCFYREPAMVESGRTGCTEDHFRVARLNGIRGAPFDAL